MTAPFTIAVPTETMKPPELRALLAATGHVFEENWDVSEDCACLSVDDDNGRELTFVIFASPERKWTYYVGRAEGFRSAGIAQTPDAIEAMVDWYFRAGEFPAHGIIEGSDSL